MLLDALPILYIAKFKTRKMDKFTLDRKNITIRAFDKPISKRFSPNIRATNMMFFHKF